MLYLKREKVPERTRAEACGAVSFRTQLAWGARVGACVGDVRPLPYSHAKTGRYCTQNAGTEIGRIEQQI